jgi:glycosyltransferase involved in cell wall biosynthesis
MQNKEKPSITIGIPVFNEEKNILNLLQDIECQNLDGFKLDKIIIYSDGSTDKTVSIAKKTHLKKLKVIESKLRLGIATGLNEIIKSSTSDILLTFDGDIRIKDEQFIRKLIKPIVFYNTDHTSSAIKDIQPRNFFERSLSVSMQLKDVLFSNFKKGNNLYTCHGLARAYSRKFYKSLKFPVSIGNDMYGYLACVSSGHIFKYVSIASVFYRLPNSFTDHKKQSNRFSQASSEMLKYFEPEFLERESKINFPTYVRSFFEAFGLIVTSPFYIITYLLIQSYLKYFSGHTHVGQTWDIARSSKI